MTTEYNPTQELGVKSPTDPSSEEVDIVTNETSELETRDKFAACSVTPEKRVVLLHTSGPMNGMHRILGVVEELPPFLNGPCRVADDEHVTQFSSLISVKPRWALYRESTEDAGLTGKLGEFHPEQR